MKTKITLAICAMALMCVASVANAQNCGCANGNTNTAGHCQGYTQAEAEALWAGYCGENCWGNPDEVVLPNRRCFGCGIFGCHGGSTGCGGCNSGFAGFGGRCGGLKGCGLGVGKLFGCNKGGRFLGGRCGNGGGSCFGWANSGCNSCNTGCGTQVVQSAGCGGCGKCGKCVFGKFKNCLSGRLRCGRGAHGVGYTSSYGRGFIGNACGFMNRAGYGSMGSCCGTGVVSNNCGCGGTVAPPSSAVPTPAHGTAEPQIAAPQTDQPAMPKDNKDGGK